MLLRDMPTLAASLSGLDLSGDLQPNPCAFIQSGISMTKPYVKPTLVRREVLSKVTAQIAPSGEDPPPPPP
jgi:hypothetical protein